MAFKTRSLIDEMIAEGFPLPEECREARIIIGIDDTMMIQYDCFLTVDQAVKLGNALKRLADPPKQNDAPPFEPWITRP